MTDEHEDCGCSEYHELSRRQFLQTAGGASAAAAAMAAFPDWLPKVVLAKHYSSTRDVIVSVFQRGGIDGLSAVVPYADANYYTARPTIAIPRPDANVTNKSIALDNYFAFSQGMAGLVPAFMSGNLVVIQATGQLNNSRSHFDAQRYMEVGKPVDPSITTGWLGRHLATVPPANNGVLRGIGVASGLQKTLVGGPQTLPIADPTNYTIGGSNSTSAARTAVIQANYTGTSEPLQTAALNAIATIALLKTVNFNQATNNGAVYPTSSFGKALKSVAALIKSGIGLEAAQVDAGGWDTHAQQDPNFGSMFNTMNDFAMSLGAFWQDVILQGYNVTLVSVSEFGRNVRENGSAGTDHGRGTTMLAMGQHIAGGKVLTPGGWPGIAPENLEDGQDLKVTVDYRDILAEIVANRLENSANLASVFPAWTPTFRGVTK